MVITTIDYNHSLTDDSADMPLMVSDHHLRTLLCVTHFIATVRWSLIMTKKQITYTRLAIRKAANKKRGSKVKVESVVSKFTSENDRRGTVFRNAGTYIPKCTVS